ncbi:MAG TPA: TIGR01210 family radical SAM protein, partial [Methanoregulaceae archaeon]|nr:TIGR01210 family radical SAM protein [Methanoregulaceae archaeon]
MERPLACWKGEERYEGEVLPSLTIILKTGGCRHNRCRMCSYRFERYPEGTDLEGALLSQLHWVVQHYPPSGVAIVKLYTS